MANREELNKKALEVGIEHPEEFETKALLQEEIDKRTVLSEGNPDEEHQLDVVQELEETKEDERSEYNCPTCKGDGIEDYGSLNHLKRICTQCFGTGKI